MSMRVLEVLSILIVVLVCIVVAITLHETLGKGAMGLSVILAGILGYFSIDLARWLHRKNHNQ